MINKKKSKEIENTNINERERDLGVDYRERGVGREQRKSMMQIFLIFGCPCLLSSFLNPYEGKERDAEREGCFFFPKLIILGFLHLILKPYHPTSISADARSCIQLFVFFFFFFFWCLDKT